VTIIIVWTDVEEVNGSTNDGTQQSTQMGSPNVDHNYQEPIEELNTLLFNTLENTINAFGTIDWVTKKGWPQIPKWQADKKSIRTLSDDGSSDQLRKKNLFWTTLNPDLVNIITLSTWQLTTVAIVMNVNPFMAIVPTNVYAFNYWSIMTMMILLYIFDN